MQTKLPQSVFIHRGLAEETLKAQTLQGKRLLEPFKKFAAENGLPVNILEDREVSNKAEVHRHEADLWVCLEGEVEFAVGGVLVNPVVQVRSDGSKNDLELSSFEIKNGTSYVMRKGDMLFIPAGQPHLHKTDGVARLFIIKIPQREIPLESVPGWK